MIYPEPAKLKRAGSSVTKEQNVSEARLSLARAVLRHGLGEEFAGALDQFAPFRRTDIGCLLTGLENSPPFGELVGHPCQLFARMAGDR